MRALYMSALTMAIFAVGCKPSSAPAGRRDHFQEAVPLSGINAIATPPTGAPPANRGEAIDIQGAGATLPYLLYSNWIDEFENVDPNVRIAYQPIGSGGGIRQIIERSVDFGASDEAMSDEERATAPSKLLSLPMTLGAVVVAYNLQGVTDLKLSQEAVAGIFSGEINRWDDPRLARLNPGVNLPGEPMEVLVRSDRSGTTAIFTDFLSKVSTTWKKRIGEGKRVRFPVGLGVRGNEGVAAQIKTRSGAIGYVELAYATQAGLSYAAIENQSGNYIVPTLDTITAAAAGAARIMPDDLCLSIVDGEGAQAYPIAAFSYIVVYQEQDEVLKGRALAQFLWWAIHQGQSYGAMLHYAPLPAEIVSKIEPKLKSLHANGEPLLGAR